MINKDSLITSPLTEALNSLSNLGDKKTSLDLIDEDYKTITKNERVETYYPKELSDFLEKVNNSSKLGGQFKGVRLSSKFNPNYVFIIRSVRYYPIKKVEVSNKETAVNLDKKYVGRELVIFCDVYPDEDHMSFKDHIDRHDVTTRRMVEVLNGDLWVEPYKDNKFIEKNTYLTADQLKDNYNNFKNLIDLYNEAVTNVVNEQERRLMSTDEVAFQNAVKTIREPEDKNKYEYVFGLLEWCDLHITTVYVSVREGLVDYFHDRYPDYGEVDYVASDTDKQSWQVVFRFDTAEGCPDLSMADKIKKDKSYSSVGLFAALYDDGINLNRHGTRRNRS